MVATYGAVGKRQAKDQFGPEDFRFTQGKNGAVYAYTSVPNGMAELTIRSLGRRTVGAIKRVVLLGYADAVPWQQTDDGLTVKLPTLAGSDIGIGFRVEV